MAQVFLARHVIHGALFAVKVLAAHLAENERVVARFRIEAELEAELSGHPNIVPVFDIGEGEGLHYLVMPYIRGEDLASLVSRQGRLRPPDAANIVAQVAEALSWAEARHVVHRDLKPANIRLDTSGRAIVVDFGIAKASDGAGGLTLPGEGLGTPYYMSPEQFLLEECDARSDLYSLGAVFFELLTGVRPFQGDSFAAIRNAHLALPVPRIRSFDPQLPESYDEVVYRLLQKHPADRFQSATELLLELSRLGVNSSHSTVVPAIDEKANHRTARTLLSDPRPEVPQPSRHRLPRVVTLGLITVTLLVAVVAILAGLLVSRPKSAMADASGAMVLVPGGNFIFGDDSAGSPNPRRTISLPSFYVDQTEVSNAQYKRFCDATGHATPTSATFLSQPDYPVAQVTFADAEAYSAWAGKRLPTEQEWEKAARGHDGRPYPWGWAGWTEGIPHDLQPVDSFKARQSPVGALNMAGNVFEWTSSPYPATDSEYAGGNGIETARFSREWYSTKGGSFSPTGDPRFFRSFARLGVPKDYHSRYIGFRCVRDIPASSWWGKLRSALLE
jgi:eukaryotic-like serine/threonine-protein kinase